MRASMSRWSVQRRLDARRTEIIQLILEHFASCADGSPAVLAVTGESASVPKTKSSTTWFELRDPRAPASGASCGDAEDAAPKAQHANCSDVSSAHPLTRRPSSCTPANLVKILEHVRARPKGREKIMAWFARLAAAASLCARFARARRRSSLPDRAIPPLPRSRHRRRDRRLDPAQEHRRRPGRPQRHGPSARVRAQDPRLSGVRTRHGAGFPARVFGLLMTPQAPSAPWCSTPTTTASR